MAVGLTTESREETAEETRRHPLLWDLWVLVVLIGLGPAMVIINNPEGPPPWTAALVVAVSLALALTLRSFLVRIGLDARGATYGIALTGLAVFNGGILLESLPRWVVIAVAMAAGIIGYRLRRVRLFQFLVSWACLAAAVTPMVTAVQNMRIGAEPVTIESPTPGPFVSTPDVVLIVVDGYGRTDVLAERYGFDNGPFADSLESLGMSVNSRMTSNYARTKFSVTSLLELGYFPEGAEATPGFEAGLVPIMGGNNAMVDVMRRNGYRTVYLESGWLGTQCQSTVDVCLPGPWPDESFFDIAYRSVFRDLPGLEFGIAFSRGAVHTMDLLDSSLRRYLEDGVADFIYVHLLVPHPPFFLNASCEMMPSREMAGFSVGFPDQTKAQTLARMNGYLDQVQCVNSQLMLAAQSIVDSGSIGLLFGDHGPDQSAQLFRDVSRWSDEEKTERFGIFFAAHHPGCDYSDLASLVNAGRRLLACLSGEEVAVLPDRYFDVAKESEPTTIVEVDVPWTTRD